MTRESSAQPRGPRLVGAPDRAIWGFLGRAVVGAGALLVIASCGSEVPERTLGVCEGAPSVCDPPSNSSVRLCGTLVDIETGEKIAASEPTGARCGADGQGPPCALELDVVEMTDQGPRRIDEATIDDCGRFFTDLVDVRRSPIVGLRVQGTVNGDSYVSTVTSQLVVPGTLRTGVEAFATSSATDRRWTDSAGDPLNGTTLGEAGVYLARFGDTRPATGVTATVGGAVAPESDYYFDDAATRVSNVAPAQDATGANGIALLVGVPLQEIGGTGGDLADECEWRPSEGGAFPGVVWVGEHPARVKGDAFEKCPVLP